MSICHLTSSETGCGRGLCSLLLPRGADGYVHQVHDASSAATADGAPAPGPPSKHRQARQEVRESKTPAPHSGAAPRVCSVSFRRKLSSSPPHETRKRPGRGDPWRRPSCTTAPPSAAAVRTLSSRPRWTATSAASKHEED